MPTYEYKAKDGPGRTLVGEMKAESRAAALADLNAAGYSPVWIRERELSGSRWPGLATAGVRPRDVTVLTRQLAALLRAGVPILRAFSTIAEQTENRRLAATVRDMEAAVRAGGMFSEAAQRHPRVFPELYVSMVRAGESSGALDTVLFRLAEAREREEETRRRVQSAMAYPMLVLATGIVTVFVLLSFFLPRIVGLFRNFRNLPLPTRILIGVSDFFAAYWGWVLILGLLGGAIVGRLAALEKGRTFVDGFKLRLPLMGDYLRDADIARFSRTMALMIESGIAMDRALALGADTLRNSVLRGEAESVRKGVVSLGAGVADGLRKCRHVPPFVAHMAAVGEQAGRLDQSMSEIGEYYERELDRKSRLAVSLVEPVLILLVGSVVGLIVFAMLLPIFRLSGAL